MSMSPPSPRRIAGVLSSVEAVFSNEELLFEILRHLPTKYLLRSKSVCKLWRLIISEPRFAPTSISGLFLSIFSRNLYVGFDTGKQRRKSVPVVTDALASNMTIYDSCHGLLLCVIRSGSESTCRYCSGNCSSPFQIYNPTTNQSATIPPPPCSYPRTQNFCCANLVFDLHSRQFKVVIVAGFLTQFHNEKGFVDHQIKIYSTETGTWRLCAKTFVSPLLAFKSHTGVYFNGTIHWPHVGTVPSLRFDVDRESLSTMPLSPYPDPAPRRGTPIRHRNIGYFGESRGHLHLIEFKNLYSTETVFDVLEMESDYSNWFVKYHVNLDQAIIKPGAELAPPDSCTYGRFSVLDLVREVKEEESYLVMYVPGKIVFYTFKDNTLAKLSDDVVIPPEDGSGRSSFLVYGWRLAFRYREAVLQF